MEEARLRELVAEVVQQQLDLLWQKLGAVIAERQAECLTVQGAAAVMGVSTKHVRRAIQQGKLACSNLGSDKRPTYRIARRDIDAWLEASRLKQAPPRSERQALVEKYFGKRRPKVVA